MIFIMILDKVNSKMSVLGILAISACTNEVSVSSNDTVSYETPQAAWDQSTVKLAVDPYLGENFPLLLDKSPALPQICTNQYCEPVRFEMTEDLVCREGVVILTTLDNAWMNPNLLSVRELKNDPSTNSLSEMVIELGTDNILSDELDDFFDPSDVVLNELNQSLPLSTPESPDYKSLCYEQKCFTFAK